MNKIKLLLPAIKIPLKTKVTKINGTKEYTLVDKIKIYNEDCSFKEVKCDENTRMLLGDEGNVNIISGDKELCWYATLQEISLYIEELELNNEIKRMF